MLVGLDTILSKKKKTYIRARSLGLMLPCCGLYVFGSRLCDSVSPTVEQRVIRAPSTEGYVYIRVWALSTLTNQAWPSFLSKSIEQAIVKEKKHAGIKDQETQ